MNYCKNCVHFVLNETDPHSYSKCRRNLAPTEGVEIISLVSGEPRMNPKLLYCDQQRDRDEQCGREGKYFEARIFAVVS